MPPIAKPKKVAPVKGGAIGGMGKKKSGGICRKLSAAALGAFMLCGCAATQAFVEHHPEAGPVLDAITAGMTCADPLIAGIENGVSWQTLSSAALACVAQLIIDGKLGEADKPAAVAAATAELQVARDNALKAKAKGLCPSTASIKPSRSEVIAFVGSIKL